MQTADKTIARWVEAFILAKRAEGRASSTIRFYREKLPRLLRWWAAQSILTPADITPDSLRRLLVDLEAEGHNPGGLLTYYRAARAFVRWWAAETEPPNWRNPFERVKAPAVPDEPLDPATVADVRALLEGCTTRTGHRNRAAILALFDTGIRAGELVALDRADVDATLGTVTIRRGKGGKGRAAFLGQKARRAMRAYLNRRGDRAGPLFLAEHGGRLTYKGLREIVRRAAKAAGIPPPKLHALRRGFAIETLRGGADLLTVARLLGHAGTEVTERYLKLLPDDLQTAHAKTSPGDKLTR